MSSSRFQASEIPPAPRISASTGAEGPTTLGDEPSWVHTRLIRSLINSQPATSDGFVAFGESTGPLSWRWSAIDVAMAIRLPAALRQLRPPPAVNAIGMVNRATARDLRDPTSPGVPVVVVYAITRDAGSVSVLVYKDAPAVWCTSPVGELADAASEIFAA